MLWSFFLLFRAIFVAVKMKTKQFVVEEILNNCINMALDTYLLVGADGEGTEADIQPELNELVKVRGDFDLRYTHVQWGASENENYFVHESIGVRERVSPYIHADRVFMLFIEH